LENIHPGFFFMRRTDARNFKGLGAVKEFFEQIQADHEKKQKRQESQGARYPEPFVFI
jgi:hypothetical protein